MIRALKAAFFLRWPIAGLGDVPLNLVGLACLGVLGVANPGFWLAGIALETGYLAALVSNQRFNRWVDAMDRAVETGSIDQKRKALIQQLDAGDRRAYDKLGGQCARIEELWRSGQSDEVMIDTNVQALRELKWSYLKLLIARQHLTGSEAEADASTVKQEADAIERELADQRLTPASRESKTATLAILRKRIENFGRRDEALQEIRSGLDRIEAQVQLVRENATLDGKPQIVSATIDVASDTLDAGVFGSSAGDIADLDAAYSERARQRA